MQKLLRNVSWFKIAVGLCYDVSVLFGCLAFVSYKLLAFKYLKVPFKDKAHWRHMNL